MRLRTALLLTVLACAGCGSISDTYFRNPLFVRLQVQPDEGAPAEPPAAFWSNAQGGMAADSGSQALLRSLVQKPVSFHVLGYDDPDPAPLDAPLVFWHRDGGVEVGELEGQGYALRRALQLQGRSNGLRIKASGATEDPFMGYDAWDLPVLLALEDYVLRKLEGWHCVGPTFATREEHEADLATRCQDYRAHFRWED